MVQLYSSFFHRPMKNFYENEYLHMLVREAPNSEILTEKPNQIDQSRNHASDTQPEENQIKKPEVAFDSGFPPKATFVKYYHRVSSCYMVYVIIRNILRYQDFLSSSLGLELPTHCYLPGQFRLFSTEATRFGLLLCTYHQLWRFLFRYFPRKKFRSDMIAFLLQDDQILERQYQTAGKCYTFAEGLYLSPRDRYVRSLMYYEVQHPTKSLYRLRPTRTRLAKQELVHELSVCSLFSLSIFFILFCIIFPPTAYAVFNDKHYVQSYPKCYPQLDEWNREGLLDVALSITMKNHRIYALLFDVLENFILWMDSGFALFLVMSIAYNLNCDVILYSSYLHRRLEETLYRLRLETALLEADEEMDQLSDGRMFQRDFNAKGPLIDRRRHLSIYPAQSPNFSKSVVPISRLGESQGLKNLIFEVQAETFDFFYQVEIIDLIVSDLMTCATLIWTFTFALVTYSSLVNKDVNDSQIGPQFIQAMGFGTFSFSSFFLLQLNRRTGRSYRTLCSLMAHDRSEHKKRFIEVLEFYKGHNCSTYTLLHLFPFYPTTYLTIVGWTFSCFIIVEKLFRDTAHE